MQERDDQSTNFPVEGSLETWTDQQLLDEWGNLVQQLLDEWGDLVLHAPLDDITMYEMRRIHAEIERRRLKTRIL